MAAADAYNAAFDADPNDPRLPALAIREETAMAARDAAERVYLASCHAPTGTFATIAHRYRTENPMICSV